jgi:hypothetical protein
MNAGALSPALSKIIPRDSAHKTNLTTKQRQQPPETEQEIADTKP